MTPGRPRLARRRTASRTALRTAAAWSWRLIVVIAGFYVLLYAAAYVAVVVVPVIVALLLAALLQPGAAVAGPARLAAVAGRLHDADRRARRGRRDHHAGRRAVHRRLLRPRRPGQRGHRAGADFVVRTFPITRGQLEDAVAQVQETLVDNQDTIASGALTTAATVGEVFAGIVLALFTLFFFLKDGRSIWLWLVGLFPQDSRAYIDEAARRSWRTLISYVRATAAVALVDAIGIGIGLAILGVPLVIPLAALVFLGAFIPIIGSFLAGTVAVLVALVSEGPITALIALGVVVAVMQLEGHVLQPLLLGRAVRVHPLAVVLAIAAGLLIAGIFGALIAVPTVACANVAGTYLSRRHDGPRPPEPRPDRARPAVTATLGATIRDPALDGGQRDVGAPVRVGQPDAGHPLVGGLPGGGEVGADGRSRPAPGRRRRPPSRRRPRAVPACSTPSPSAPVIGCAGARRLGIARARRRRRSPRRPRASAAAGGRRACRWPRRAAARPAASPAAAARPGSRGRRSGR